MINSFRSSNVYPLDVFLQKTIPNRRKTALDGAYIRTCGQKFFKESSVETWPYASVRLRALPFRKHLSFFSSEKIIFKSAIERCIKNVTPFVCTKKKRFPLSEALSLLMMETSIFVLLRAGLFPGNLFLISFQSFKDRVSSL